MSVIVTTPEDLAAIIKSAVTDAIAEWTVMQASGPGQSAEPQKMWNIRECADFLGISTNTLYTMAQNGLVPLVKIGKHYRFSPTEIAAWKGGPGRNEIQRSASMRRKAASRK